MDTARAARLKELNKDVDESDVENEDVIERVESRVSSSHNGTSAPSETSSEHGQPRRVLRFEDGDPENPDNWGRVSRITVYTCWYSADVMCSGRKFMPSSLQS